MCRYVSLYKCLHSTFAVTPYISTNIYQIITVIGWSYFMYPFLLAVPGSMKDNHAGKGPVLPKSFLEQLVSLDGAG